MKTYKWLPGSFIFLFFAVISACIPPTTLQATPTSSVLFANTHTATPPAHPLITPTSTPRSIYIPPPTLVPDVQDQFYGLLKNNGNCELPCFLDITPGKTSWLDAKAVLEKYSINKPIKYDETRSTPTNKTYSTQIQTRSNTNTSFWLIMNIELDVNENDVVKHIVMSVESYDNDALAINDKDGHLSTYSLREVFLRNGIPDNVFFKFRQRKGYGFGVVYENQKIAFEFGGIALPNINNEYIICPNIGEGQVSSMKIALANPSDPIDVKTLIGHPFWEGVHPFEEVAGMSLNDFYELMISDQKPACFEIK